MRLANSDFQLALLCAAVGSSIGLFGCSASSSTTASASGGTSSSGGVRSSGGSAASGSSTGTGGQISSGGSSGFGGTPATGGATNASGGRTGSGGSSSPLGGATSAGGQPASGGTTASGGASAGGQSGLGGKAAGGAGTAGTNGTGGTAGAGGAAGDSCPAGGAANTSVTINNTGPWNDTTGKHIQAHGGGFLKFCDTWYWFGEDKTLNTNGTGNFHAVGCYASKDLVTWEHRNSVVTTSTDPVLNNVNLIIERPKVLYNASTKMYVMWAHWDMESCAGGGGGYCDSEAIVFTSPTVDGNYKYEKHFQPGGGNTSRDCTLWQEPDGSAYFVSTGGPGGNAGGNFHDTEVYQLSSDYLNVQNTTKIWANDTREAYAFWKANGKYYGVSSAQPGWAPNEAAYLTSTGTLAGPWNNSFSPLGQNNSTWSSQPTYVIPIVGSETTTYIYASDLWNSNNLSLSTYLWLPLKFDGTTWSLSYSAQWSINLATGVVTGN